jgi:hypothetical protein
MEGTRMTAKERQSLVTQIGETIVGLLLIIEVIMTIMLWTLNSLTSQNEFALFLTINFISFAMMSYIYRTLTNGEALSKVLVIAGCFVIAALLFATFYLPA